MEQWLDSIAFTKDPKPRAASDWMDKFKDNPELANQFLEQAGTPAGYQMKAKIADYVAEQIIPSLQSGSDRVKSRPGLEDDFAPRCDLAKQFLAALGGPSVAPADDHTRASPPSSAEEAAAQLHKLLAQPAAVGASAALREQQRVQALLDADGLQQQDVAERVIERLQALAAALRLAKEDAEAFGDDPSAYESGAHDAEKLVAEVHRQLVAQTWRPLKLADSVDTRHGSLIRCVDRLYDEFSAEFDQMKLRFPEVVVVGAESVGKSSLLEKVAGMDFFPRGENVTTRLGFRLRLHHCTPKEMTERKQTAAAGTVVIAGKEVMMRFEDAKEYMGSVEEARARVSAENARVQEKKLGVVDKEVILNLYSSEFADLTLLDLPGIIRARGPNDPKDICKTCEKIVRAKIKNPDAIILAVLNAREGIRGAAEGIRLVQEESAEARTLAVLTCVDRCDHADDIAAVMRQEKDRELPKLGHHYHACIGRDTKRTAGGERAAPEDNEAFLAAIKRVPMAVAPAEELLRADRVSEATLGTALADLDGRKPAADLSQVDDVTPPEERAEDRLRTAIVHKLEETRANQDLFETRFFAPPPPGLEPGTRSKFQEDRNVDPRLLDPALRPFLGARALGERLSDMLTCHISSVWAPKMRKNVSKKRVEVQRRIASCGETPPSDRAPEAQITGFASSVVQVALKLLSERQDEILRLVVAEVNKVLPAAPAARQPPPWSPNGLVSPSAPMPWMDAVAKAKSVCGLDGLGAMEHIKAGVDAVLDTTDKEHAMHLRRFVILNTWVREVVRTELGKRKVGLMLKLTELVDALAPDEAVPGVTNESRQLGLYQTLRDALPRLLCRHVGKAFFDALPGLLAAPPATYEHCQVRKGTTTPIKKTYRLLAESQVNVDKRNNNTRLLQALDMVASELRRYGNEAEHKPPDPAEDHLCPISRELMIDPVTAADGHVYERSEILRWFEERQAAQGSVVRSPKTGEALPNLQVTPAHLIRGQILEWKEKHGIKDEAE